MRLPRLVLAGGRIVSYNSDHAQLLMRLGRDVMSHLLSVYTLRNGEGTLEARGPGWTVALLRWRHFVVVEVPTSGLLLILLFSSLRSCRVQGSFAGGRRGRSSWGAPLSLYRSLSLVLFSCIMLAD